ncbi:MAG: DNA alkylation repair protein [Ruminococcaceae bacterium]|nr:DNA alkylation repair protein [Oscillospiraceae bacterium]
MELKPSIREHLPELSDESYKRFQAKLMPTVSLDRIIGVRTPQIRRYAKEIFESAEAKAFLSDLPHAYYDENNLHGALLERIPDFDAAINAVEAFLPHVDNWATCDMFCPKILRTEPQRLLVFIQKWLLSDHVYTVRYGLVRLTFWYLDAPVFSPEILALAAAVEKEEYYVQMAVAWFFSMALVKQWDATLPYLTDQRLDLWIHNKAIQKAIESEQITPSQKEFLRSLKRKR